MTEQERAAAHAQASTRYNAANVKQVKLNLNRKTDADIIGYLDGVQNVQGLIKNLLREQMKK